MFSRLNKAVEKWIDSKEYGFTNKKKKVNIDDSTVDKSMKSTNEDDDTQKVSEPYANRKSGLKFLSVFSKFFSSDWSVSKIKIPEQVKYWGFDTKNHCLTVITKERLMYFVELPKKASRYLKKARIIPF